MRNDHWTQEQAIAYESARECITHLIALLHHGIQKHQVAGLSVVQEQARVTELLAMKRSLRVGDDNEIARIRLEIGSEVRKLNGQLRDEMNLP